MSQRLDLRSSNKHVALQNLCIYYTWKNIKNQYKNNEIKTIAPTWIDEFELPSGYYSVSDIRLSVTKYLRLTHLSLIAIFWDFFAIFVLAGRLGTRLSFYEV